MIHGLLNNIQVLRAFAAIIVVVFHIVGASDSYKMSTELFSLTGSLGRSGVDIFFIISGFIMLYTQHNKTTTPIKFIKDRFIRVVPIYWFFSLLFLSIYLVMPSIFREYQPNLGFIISSFLFSSEWVLKKHPLLSVGWTLEYEMLFYFVFSIALVFSLKNRFYIPIILILFLPVFPNIDFVIYEFLLGMLVAKIYLDQKLKINGWILLIISIVLFAFLNTFANDLHRLIIFGIPSFFLVLAVLNLSSITNKFLLHLGNASYSIYLVQVFTLPLFYKIASNYFSFINFDILAVAALAVSIVAGSVSYLLIEKPLTRILKQKKLNKSLNYA